MPFSGILESGAAAREEPVGTGCCWVGGRLSVSQELEEYVVGQLESAGTVRSRRMFGGVGLYID